MVKEPDTKSRDHVSWCQVFPQVTRIRGPLNWQWQSSGISCPDLKQELYLGRLSSQGPCGRSSLCSCPSLLSQAGPQMLPNVPGCQHVPHSQACPSALLRLPAPAPPGPWAGPQCRKPCRCLSQGGRSLVPVLRGEHTQRYLWPKYLVKQFLRTLKNQRTSALHGTHKRFQWDLRRC